MTAGDPTPLNTPLTTLAPGAAVGELQVEGVVDVTVEVATYLASDPALGTRFLVREYLPADLANRSANGQLAAKDSASEAPFLRGLEAFLAQGRIMASLAHPNVLGVVRVFRANGTACLQAPFEEGRSLARLLKDETPPDPAMVRDWLVALAGALEQAHDADILHESIRPEAILITASGEPRLLDFSRAALRLADDELPIRQDAYTASEQVIQGETGPWTDVYGLSATLYQALTGKAPVPAEQRLDAIRNGLQDPLEPLPDELRSLSTEGLCEAIDHGLALEPSDRPADVDSWRQSLTSLDWRKAVHTPAAEKTEGKEWLPPMLLGAVLAVLLVAILWLAFSDKPEPSDTLPAEAATEPDRPPPVPPEETRRWQAALRADTVLAYREFLEDYPESVYGQQAGLQLDILDERTWAELSPEDTREAYADYLELFPLGKHQETARKRIDEIDRELARIERERLERERQDEAAWEAAASERTVASMDTYLQAWPDGAHADEARGIRAAVLNSTNDLKAFDSAKSLNTPEAIQAYIDAFPQGEHVAEALEIMDRIDLRPGKRFRDCPECPTMVVVPAGSFLQGSPEGSEMATNVEKPQRTVTITESFAIGIHEITFTQWDACVADGGCGQNPPDNGWGRDQRPVIMVSWDDVQEYLQWLGERSGQTYRLPSESEWEYAARAGEEGEWLGGSPAAVCLFGNVAGSESGFRWQHEDCAENQALGTSPVGSFRANRFGLFDVIGNVAEWTADCINLSYLGAPTDGSAWGRGICSSHMTRGGSWVTGTREIRLPARFNLTNGDRNDFTGFRVVRSVDN